MDFVCIVTINKIQNNFVFYIIWFMLSAGFSDIITTQHACRTGYLLCSVPKPSTDVIYIFLFSEEQRIQQVSIKTHIHFFSKLFPHVMVTGQIQLLSESLYPENG